MWLPTLRHHPYPVVSRDHYVEGIRVVYADLVDVSELEERLILHRYIWGRHRHPRAREVLEHWVRSRPVDAVVVPTYLVEWFSEIETVLEEADFTSRRYYYYSVFTRKKVLQKQNGLPLSPGRARFSIFLETSSTNRSATNAAQFCAARSRRRLMPRPMRPVPSRRRILGSGAGAGVAPKPDCPSFWTEPVRNVGGIGDVNPMIVPSDGPLPCHAIGTAR